MAHWDKEFLKGALGLIEDVINCDEKTCCNTCRATFCGTGKRDCLMAGRRAAEILEAAFHNEILDYNRHYDENDEPIEETEEDEK